MINLRTDKIIDLDIDGDGVVFDYHEAYARVWKNVYGEDLQEVDPTAFHAYERFNVPRLTDTTRFREGFTEEIWGTMKLLDGVQEACKILIDAGCRLNMVTALSKRFESARASNLALHNLGFSDCIATDLLGDGQNLKYHVLNKRLPAAFVDDFPLFLHGVDAKIHCCLIDPYGKQSDNPYAKRADSIESSLLSFAKRFAEQRRLANA